MRHLILLALFLCHGVSASFPSQLLVSSRSDERQLLRIHHTCTSFQLAAGSGAYLMTAKHCLDPSYRQYIALHGFRGEIGSEIDFRHLTRLSHFEELGNETVDLAYRYLPAAALDKATPRLRLASRAPGIGEPLLIPGFPKAKGPYVVACTGLGHQAGGVEVGGTTMVRVTWQVACELPEGMDRDLGTLSGAPALNQDGEVVGVFVSVAHDAATHETIGLYGVELLAMDNLQGYGKPVISYQPGMDEGAFELFHRAAGSAEVVRIQASFSGGRLHGAYSLSTPDGTVLDEVHFEHGRMGLPQERGQAGM